VLYCKRKQTALSLIHHIHLFFLFIFGLVLVLNTDCDEHEKGRSTGFSSGITALHWHKGTATNTSDHEKVQYCLSSTFQKSQDRLNFKICGFCFWIL